MSIGQLCVRQAAWAVACAFCASAAQANPVGPSVGAGSAGFRTHGGRLTVRNAPGTILNWQSFSVGAGEHTRFRQESSLSAVLNRVTGGDPSSILGRLSSNGRVFLINPNGIVFGQGARIDTAGFVASTLNMSDQDFLAGRLKFEGGGSGVLRNEGAIRARGDIYLVGPQIENAGLIRSAAGSVLLAAGQSVTITSPDAHGVQFALQAPADSAINLGKIEAGNAAGMFAGTLVHSGEIRAGSAVAGADGRVFLVAPVVIQTGAISADGSKGGSVVIDATNYLQAAPISASGESGSGGEIIVRAQKVIQTAAAAMHADGGRNGDGGKITLQAGDAEGGRLFSSAAFSARGERGGDIKLLGRDVVLLGASVDASGTNGGGTILVGGDLQGRNPAIANAATTNVNFSTALKADALASGDGGKVIVWSDNGTKFYGTASARGGAQSGDGGFMEISGKESLVMGGLADAGARNGVPGRLLLDPKNIVIDSAGATGGIASFQLADPHPGTNERFAEQVVALPNGNVVVTDPKDSFVAANAGAVYLFNGSTGALISALTGSVANDQVGKFAAVISPSVTVLANGNFVVTSPNWNNGAATLAGAATWASGTAGVSGTVSAANSLVGTHTSDMVGLNGVTALTNGNYVVNSSLWSNGAATNAGAATWGNGVTGIVGAVSAANSLVGSTNFDNVGGNKSVALSNGNYVVLSPQWNNGAVARAGAATWGNGATGTTGVVSAANSLVGSTAFDGVGSGSAIALANGNYVVGSPVWHSGGMALGAATWGNGTTGTSGAISAANSLVGSQNQDQVGIRLTALSNGNYVVGSRWSDGAVQGVGAATWGNGATGITGTISAANSLIGDVAFDSVGDSIVALANGNYVVNIPTWHGGAGAATWGNGGGGTVGVVSAANSLVGTGTSTSVIALPNGNYVVGAPGSANGVGSATWGDGTTGVSGTITAANSLVGSVAGDIVGTKIIALTNGNYVVGSSNWNGGIGAVTWGNGATGTVGAVSAANSLTGSAAGDAVGGGLTALANGNYVVGSSLNGLGGTTWVSGAASASATVSAANTLLGGFNVTALPDGNYIVSNTAFGANQGSVTWGNGATGTVGTISAANSLIGATANDSLGQGALSLPGSPGITPLANGSAVVLSPLADNGALVNAGLVHVVSPASGSLANPLTFSTNSSGTVTITPAQITAITNTGTAVILQASNDITLVAASPITTVAGGAGGAITMQAGRSILLNSNITTDNGNLTLVANERAASGVVDAQRDPGAAVITMAPGTTIDAGLGTVTVNMRDGAGLSNNASGAITLGAISAGTINLANTGSAGGGSIVFNGPMAVTGNVILSGGSLSGIGTITGNFNNTGGTLAPGSSPGALTIVGNYTQGAGGTLNLELGGTTQGVDYDVLQVTGTANLNGTLNVSLFGGFTGTAGSQFDVITYGSRVGDFLTLNFPGGATVQAVPNPAFYQLSFSPMTVAPAPTVAAVPNPVIVTVAAPDPAIVAAAAPNPEIVGKLNTTLALPANESRTLNDRFLLATSVDRREDDDSRFVGASSCR